jgi:hypothetical protein
MALSATQVYLLNADQLSEECTRRELIGEGSVRALRSRLLEYLKNALMVHKQEDGAVGQQDIQASFPAGVLNTRNEMSALPGEEGHLNEGVMRAT